MNLESLRKRGTPLRVYSQGEETLAFEHSAYALSSLERFRQLPVDQMALLVRSGVRAPGNLLERFLIFLMLARPRTAVPSLLCYALGFSYTGAKFSSHMLLGAFLIFLIVCLSNLANTYTDIEEDCCNLPGRVYLLAKLGHRHLFWLLVTINLFLIVGAAALNLYFLVVMLLGLFFANQYSFPPFRMKAHPLLGLFAFAQAVVIPFLLGGVTESGAILQALLSPEVVPLFRGEVLLR